MRLPSGLSFLLYVISLFCTNVYAGSWTATADKQQLVKGETLELTLTYQGENPVFQPDLSVLDQEFTILSTQKKNQPLSQEWKLTLQPKRAGELLIPALTLGNASSQPIRLSVSEHHVPKHLEHPLTIEATLDSASVYLQAQALLKVRIIHQTAIYPNGELSPLQLSNARVVPLGDAKTYLLNDHAANPIGVIELNYAIFPQQVGLLTIPAFTFEVTAADQSSKRLSAKSQPLLLQVLPIPKAYPAAMPWLPASQLTIEHQVLPSNGNILQGNPLTYQVSFTAHGLPSSLLPNFSMNLPEGFNLYPEAPINIEEVSDQGVFSQKQLQAAIVVNQSGHFSVPTPAITWFNTRTQQIETTALEPLTINVSPQKAIANKPSTPSAPSTGVFSTLYFWQWLSGVLFLLALINFILWRRACWVPKTPAPKVNTQSETAFNQIMQACQKNQPAAARRALDQWIKFQPETLHELSQREPQLATVLDELNRTLYSPDINQWHGEPLKTVLTALRLQQENARNNTHNLPPLYPQ